MFSLDPTVYIAYIVNIRNKEAAMGTVTARVSEETSTRLDELARATRRSKSFHLAQALDSYLETQAWQVARTLESIKQADAGEFASETEVKQAFAKWGVDIDSISEDRLDPERPERS